MSEERPKATGAPMCKICNHRHWGREPHVFGSKPPAASVTTKPRKASTVIADVETPVATVVTSPKGVTAVVHGQKRPTKKSLEALGKLIDAAADRIASKPKRKSKVVAKDGTNRGRPIKGDKPFDKKAHDRQKAKERRDAAKGKPFAGKP